MVGHPPCRARRGCRCLPAGWCRWPKGSPLSSSHTGHRSVMARRQTPNRGVSPATTSWGLRAPFSCPKGIEHARSTDPRNTAPQWRNPFLPIRSFQDHPTTGGDDRGRPLVPAEGHPQGHRAPTVLHPAGPAVLGGAAEVPSAVRQAAGPRLLAQVAQEFPGMW